MNRKKRILITLLIINLLAVSGLFYFYISEFHFFGDYINNSNISYSGIEAFEKTERNTEVEAEEIIYAESKDFNDVQINLLSSESTNIIIEEEINLKTIHINESDTDEIVKVQAVNLKEDISYELFFEIRSDYDSKFTLEISTEDNSFSIKDTFVTNKINSVSLVVSDEDLIADILLHFYEESAYKIVDFYLLSDEKINTITINQHGYLPGMNKIACFNENEGSYFEVINLENDEVVYKSGISAYVHDEKTGTNVAYGDFSSVNEEGTYYIRSQYGNYSYEFEISEGIYEELIDDALKMISIQRCGTDLPESIYGEFAHEACHVGTIEAIELGFELQISGGWHDAGDYGRYTSTTNKTIMDLMMAYIVGNELYDDEMNILESGNGVSDILDEIRYGCDYLKRIQLNDGSVFEKIITKSFAEWVLPNFDNEQLYAFPPTTINTAYTAGILMLASKIYEEVDEEYAKDCRKSALLALNYVENKEFLGIRKFDEFSNNGYYSDNEDLSERYFMFMIFGLVLEDEQYISRAIDIMQNENISITEVDYYNPSAYASYLFVKYYNGDEFVEYSDIISSKFIDKSNEIVKLSYENAYLNATDDYYWGSNYNVSDNGIILGFTYDICGESIYRDIRDYQLHYILGNNALNTSFISAYGDVFPENVHHRICSVNNVYIDGAMVGGANQDREIIEDSDYIIEKPALDYLDSVYSYSTNEVAIYYNSSLDLLLALINS